MVIVVGRRSRSGIIPIAARTFWDAFPELVRHDHALGISATALVAVVLNVLFNEVKAGNRPGASVFAAAGRKGSLGDTLDDDTDAEPRRPVAAPTRSTFRRTTHPQSTEDPSTSEHIPTRRTKGAVMTQPPHQDSQQVASRAPGRRDPAGPEAGDLRLPARAGVLRRRGHRADPAGQRDRADHRAAHPPDQRRPVHLRHRLDHPVASGSGRSACKLPLLQGVTFTAVSPMIAIGMAAGGGTDGPARTSTARSSSPACSPSSSRRTSPS